MKKLLFVLLITLNPTHVLAEPVPIDNTVPPCDSSPVGNKPPCNIDSGSIKTTPKMPDATDGAIIVPDEPTKGLPDRGQQPGRDIIDQPKTKK